MNFFSPLSTKSGRQHILDSASILDHFSRKLELLLLIPEPSKLKRKLSVFLFNSLILSIEIHWLLNINANGGVWVKSQVCSFFGNRMDGRVKEQSVCLAQITVMVVRLVEVEQSIVMIFH